MLRGGAGNDRVFGGTSGDRLDGGAGSDRLDGGVGDDTIQAGFDSDFDTLIGADGDDELFGADGDDEISGGAGDDKVGGEDGKDKITGGSGNDVLGGQSFGATRSRGAPATTSSSARATTTTSPVGPGSDLISGGPGNDTIRAKDHRKDRIKCGAGRDVAYVDKIDKVDGCESLGANRTDRRDGARDRGDQVARPIHHRPRHVGWRLPRRHGRRTSPARSALSTATHPTGSIYLESGWSTQARPQRRGGPDRGWQRPGALSGFRPVDGAPLDFNTRQLTEKGMRSRVQWYRTRFALPRDRRAARLAPSLRVGAQRRDGVAERQAARQPPRRASPVRASPPRLHPPGRQRAARARRRPPRQDTTCRRATASRVGGTTAASFARSTCAACATSTWPTCRWWPARARRRAWTSARWCATPSRRARPLDYTFKVSGPGGFVAEGGGSGSSVRAPAGSRKPHHLVRHPRARAVDARRPQPLRARAHAARAARPCARTSRCATGRVTPEGRVTPQRQAHRRCAARASTSPRPQHGAALSHA